RAEHQAPPRPHHAGELVQHATTAPGNVFDNLRAYHGGDGGVGKGQMTAVGLETGPPGALHEAELGQVDVHADGPRGETLHDPRTATAHIDEREVQFRE